MIRKLFGFWPASATFEMVTGPLVLFVRVSVRGVENVPAWCGCLKRTGDGVKMIADGVPVPERLTVCGLPGALSFTCTTALAPPTAVGKNCTLIVHWSPGWSGDAPTQVSLIVNCAGFVPVSVGCEMARFRSRCS